MSETENSGPSPAAGTPPNRIEIVRSLRAAAIAYAITWGAAAATTILVLIAANIGSTGDDTGVESDDTNGLGVLVGMPFQIVAMALLGSLHFSESGVGVSVFFPPLLLTALFCISVYRLSTRAVSVPDRGTRVMLAGITGLVASTVITILTWALAMRTEGVSLHAASVNLFFGAWALTSVSGYLGTTRVVGFTRPEWISADYVAAARLWCTSVLLWLAIAIPVLMVVAIFNEGLWVAVVAPIWGVTVGLYTYALGHLGGLSFSTETVRPWDLSTAWTIVVILGAIALTIVTSTAWHLRRDRRAEVLSNPWSWATLPAVYAAGGILVWLVPSIVFGGGVGAVGGSVTLQPAFWLVFVLAIWGGAVEAASRVVAPGLAESLPPSLAHRLRGPEQSPTARDPLAAPAEVTARPMTPEEKVRVRRLAIIGAGVIGVVALGFIAIGIINSQAFGPEKQAKKYLDALVAGRAEKAVTMAPVSDDAGDELLTDEVYGAAENRLTGYDIKKVKTEGDAAVLTVRLEGLASSSTVELTLQTDGKKYGVFDKWVLTEGGLARDVSLSLPDSSTSLSVNDVEIESPSEDVWALPGDYEFNPFGENKWVEVNSDPVTVSPDETYVSVDTPEVTASAAFKAELQSALDEYLAACMAAKTLDPDDCPNSAYASDVRKVVWKLDKAPTLDLSYFDGTFPADLSSDETGQATVTYESDYSFGFGAPDWQPQRDESTLYVNGTVTDTGNGLEFTFTGF